MCSSGFSKNFLASLNGANTTRIVSLFSQRPYPIRTKLKSIRWSLDFPAAAIQDMSLDYCDDEVILTEQFLNRPIQ